MWPAVAAALLPACVLITKADEEKWAEDHRGGSDSGTPDSGDTDTDTDTDTDGDTDGDTDSDTDSDTDTEADPFVDYTTAYDFEMLAISAGTFDMGSGPGDPLDVYEDHTVTLNHPFWLGRTELTQAGWANWTAVPTPPGTTPSAFAGCDACPVEQVSWRDVARYANAVSDAEGLEACYKPDGSDLLAGFSSDPYACPGYRMPTEAEWEYAARAGEDTEFAGSAVADGVAWTSENSGEVTHDVGTRDPNAWGLSDMSGNVWEWTNDWYDATYYAGSPAGDPPGPESGTIRVFRGGCWFDDTTGARVAIRFFDDPTHRSAFVGVRLARSSVDP